MAAFVTVPNRAVVALGDLGGVGTVLDVGGGHGALLAALLRAHPRIRGVLFELPHVAEGAPVEAGDFRGPRPTVVQVYRDRGHGRPGR